MADRDDETGPLVVDAYVIPEKGAKCVLQKITLPALKPTEVEIDMLCCGLCHTDIHMKDNDWGTSDFPMVAGHEGVGTVKKVGADVSTRKVGDLVGVTWIRDSCNDCSACFAGRENVCSRGYQGTYLSASAGPWGKQPYNEHGGCFAKVVRIQAKWALKVPVGLPLELACPLMCGGGTVFEPICDHVSVGTTVGVIGIGGLGTAAVRLAKLSGGVVTAVSRTASKEESILQDGASHFILSTDPEQMAAAAGTMDLIIDTQPSNSDVATWLGLLKFGGTYVRVGIPPAKDQSFMFDYIPLVFSQKKIAGSVVTGSARANLMLQVAANNPEVFAGTPMWQTQTLAFEKVNEAMEMLASEGNKGFRIVLRW